MKKKTRKKAARKPAKKTKKAGKASKKSVAGKKNSKKPIAKKASRASANASGAQRAKASGSKKRSFFAADPSKSSWHFPERKPGGRWYWLLKQEPTDFSFDDLWAAPNRTTHWNGVRNFLARNFLRDRIKKGDHAFFYHSNADPSAVVGIVEVVRDGYPDESAFDPTSPYYDGDTSAREPKWFQVDVRAVEKLPNPVSIAELRKTPALSSLVLLHISQLSVQPVTPDEWKAVVDLARRVGRAG